MDQLSSLSTIFVRNIPIQLTDREIRARFEKFGEIKNVEIKNGFCFIEFNNEFSAKEAIKEMNNKMIFDRPIFVSSYQDKRGTRPMEKRGPQADDICKNCQEKGHWAYQCPNEKRPL